MTVAIETTWVPSRTDPSETTTGPEAEQQVPDPEMTQFVSEILGYDVELIAQGLSTQPRSEAVEEYEQLLESILGYSLIGPEGWLEGLQEALDDVASGRTTVHHSTNELFGHLDRLVEDD